MKTLLATCLLALFSVNQTQALSSLKSSLPSSAALHDRKLEQTKKSDFSEVLHTKKDKETEDVRGAEINTDRLRAVIYNQVDPFSTSPEFEFFDSFVLGLELETFYEYSTECLDAVVFFIDDWAYLQNNSTLQRADRSLDRFNPVLNFTGIISGYLATSVYECYRFGYSVMTVTVADVTAFDGITDWLLAFLFN